MAQVESNELDPLDAPTALNVSRWLDDAIARVCSAPYGTFVCSPDGDSVAVVELWADGGVNTETVLTAPAALVLYARIAAWRTNGADVGDVSRAVEDARWAQSGARLAVAA